MTNSSLGCNIDYAPTLTAAQAATMFGLKYQGCATPPKPFDFSEFDNGLNGDPGLSWIGNDWTGKGSYELSDY